MPETILIVDDEYSNRYLLEQILSDYETISASSADEMWRCLSEKKIDLILLDVMMPGKDGFAAAKELGGNAEYKNIPVIFVTARREAEDIAKGFDIGGYDYIKKPYDEIELLARIKSTLKLSRQKIMLNNIALKDETTGLYNRRYLNDFIQSETEKINRGLLKMSVVMCDIDFFKRINDTYGHPCGDYILKKFSQMISHLLRNYDLAIRYGGEEFLILFPHIDKKEANIVIERMRDIQQSTEYLFDGNKIIFTFSAGIADSTEFEPKPEIINEMIQRADERLYEAKNTGRNKSVI
jgi:diguanylate cyclase (GGDEF)-like protein